MTDYTNVYFMRLNFFITLYFCGLFHTQKQPTIERNGIYEWSDVAVVVVVCVFLLLYSSHTLSVVSKIFEVRINFSVKWIEVKPKRTLQTWFNLGTIVLSHFTHTKWFVCLFSLYCFLAQSFPHTHTRRFLFYLFVNVHFIPFVC